MELSKKAIVFIPGGPCISGKYWDDYLHEQGAKWFSDFDLYRLVLPNHEEYYSEKVSLTFEEASSIVSGEIGSLSNYDEINICAHSYGGWILLKILNSLQVKLKLKQVFIVSTPRQLYYSEKFQLTKKLNNSPIVVEDDYKFSLYIKSIGKLYFYQNVEKWSDKVFSDSFWEFNRQMAINSEFQISELFNQVISLNIILINGQNDMLLDDIDGRYGIPVYENAHLEIIPSCGHFPMLEQSEILTEIIYKYL